jgi:hypothetical protein
MPKQVTNEELATMIKNGFEDQHGHFTQEVNKVSGRIDLLQQELKDDIHRLEFKIDRTLHAEYSNLEVRVKRIENKIGLKPINESAS